MWYHRLHPPRAGGDVIGRNWRYLRGHSGPGPLFPCSGRADRRFRHFTDSEHILMIGPDQSWMDMTPMFVSIGTPGLLSRDHVFPAAMMTTQGELSSLLAFSLALLTQWRKENFKGKVHVGHKGICRCNQAFQTNKKYMVFMVLFLYWRNFGAAIPTYLFSTYVYIFFLPPSL